MKIDLGLAKWKGCQCFGSTKILSCCMLPNHILTLSLFRLIRFIQIANYRNNTGLVNIR
jgi:hypothetical protein